ncbi:MAG: FKBP-type peptidyl-prolyl cis-trans isomerase [Ignavibacteriae bacterium]|nr:FKBP-type peptidyl-prolyl cis-trans isomerase [Ignavibacteriota bacterium]
MKSLWIAVICFGLLACQGNTQDKVEMKSQMDTISYSIGVDIGKNLKAQSIEINPAVLVKGVNDGFTGEKTLLSDQAMQDAMSRFQQDLMARQREEAKELGEKQKVEGSTFLEANKKKEGVKTTASGLQYKILKVGTGPKPTVTQQVTVNYRGTLVDGTEFDNSYKRGKPETFSVSGIIKGWTEALQLMPVGSKWELYIPPDLGYGESGAGGAIPPNAVLILEVELLSIK